MTTGNLVTNQGKLICINRTFNTVPSYSVVGWFKAGVGTNTPSEGDTDMQTPIHITTADSGTTTATLANHLVDATQNFLATVSIGYAVKNTTDNTYSVVTAVNSNTDLTLASDIMIIGETYTVGNPLKAIAVATVDEPTLTSTNECVLLTTDANGNYLTEFGLFNNDGTKKCFSRAVYTGITKTASVQVIYTEKDVVE